MARILFLLLAVLTVRSAHAQSALSVTPVDTLPGGAILVRVDLHYAWHWDPACFDIPFNCGSSGYSIRIAPCPPLIPCPGDYSTITGHALDPDVTLLLASGVSYELSGSWWLEKLHPTSCDHVICADGESFGPVVFPEPDVPIGPSSWSTLKRLYE